MKELYNVKIKYYFYLILNMLISILPINKKDKEGLTSVYGDYIKKLKKRRNVLEKDEKNIFTPEECANVLLKNSEYCRNY